MAKNQNSGTQDITDLPVITAQYYALFGPPPILPTESRNRYIHLMSRALAAVDKTNFFECILVEKFAVATWEIERVTVAKAEINNAARKEALRRLLTSTLNSPDVETKTDNYVREWFSGEISDELGGHMATYDISDKTIASEALKLNLSTLQELEALQEQIERRRDNALRELERYRANSSKRPRKSSNDIITLPPEDIESFPASTS